MPHSWITRGQSREYLNDAAIEIIFALLRAVAQSEPDARFNCAVLDEWWDHIENSGPGLMKIDLDDYDKSGQNRTSLLELLILLDKTLVGFGSVIPGKLLN